MVIIFTNGTNDSCCKNDAFFQNERQMVKNFIDNTLHLSINKSLNNKDYKVIISHFESIGGPLIKHKYKKDDKILELIFLEGAKKQKILKKKVFNINYYTLEASEINRKRNLNKHLEKFNNLLIIENIDFNEDNKKLRSQLDFVFENKGFSKKVQSIINNNLVFFKFDDFIDENNYFHDNQALNGKEIKIHEAFETSSILVKLDSSRFNEKYLNEKFKLNDLMYWQVPFKMDNSPFVIVKFLNIDYKYKFLMNYSQTVNKEYLIENIFNWALLNDYLSAYKHTVEFQNTKEEKHKCKKCPYKSFTKTKMLKHKTHHKFKKNSFKCRYCYFFARSNRGIYSHEKLHC